MCKNQCLLARCKIREAGGCYCKCKQRDYEIEQQSIKDGYTKIINGASIYSPTKFGELPESEPLMQDVKVAYTMKPVSVILNDDWINNLKDTE